ncbi:hypothetical protein CSW25_02415 [Thermus scotoductus]|uniref:Carboxypeptidase regulatory-like domain-containing protein n=1 Tax=Thermus scotoductus TaxID=37636 RepID=A0A430UFR9_THESC|nr:hypothetical protein [Thermus scotoductus]RTG98054.1 hypothetical protein CSW49_01775 [Thermus scotoductus]RTH06627.1 hypothetical protein CSW45_01565 [Thermus scotoductus]RTH19766.1 hypothetical protein CSW39_01880 [Thermus scotoductus]RTH22421.1 hypothetical protein CSW42_02905 [Thermus scotoductus]RTH34731.1 hypothetical protein CSW35_02255 [Thermus scotoductus]
MGGKFGLLFLLGLGLALAQAPIPRPKPPEEPKPTWVLRVEVTKAGAPLPGVLVLLQEVSPNRLPIRQSLPRFTGPQGWVELRLEADPKGYLLLLQSREENLRVQAPLAVLLGSWSLGPYRFTLTLTTP